MPLPRLGCVLLVALGLPTVAGPVQAGGDPYAAPGIRHRRAVMLPPDVPYRDPRYAPPRRARALAAPPAALISGYLPRYTDRPLYNEPPSRFQQR